MASTDTITNYFNNILLRDPTSAELSSYETRVAAGFTLEEVRDELIATPESQTYAQQIIRMYQAAFGRIPDAAGLDGWVDGVRDGSLTTTDLANGFIHSDEWSALYGSAVVSNTAIQTLYQNMLDRAASTEEVDAWVATGQDIGQILIQIANSGEAQASCNPAVVALQQAAGDADNPADIYVGAGNLCELYMANSTDPLDTTGPDTDTPTGGGGGGTSTVNNAPDAVDDAYSTLGNGDVVQTAATGLLANDTDPGDTFKVISIEDHTGLDIAAGAAATLANGEVTVETDGSFSFTPTTDFQGEQTFTYTIEDSAGQTDTATVTVDVNQAPDAVDDVYDAFAGLTAIVEGADGLLANDTDPGDTLTVTTVTGTGVPTAAGATVATTNGSVTVQSDGSFVYEPVSGYTGTDTFTYTTTDADGATDTATVTFTVAEAGVWFIDNSVAGGPGTGTQEDPFRSIADFNAANGAAGGPEIGDTIYLREGTGTYTETDGFNLLDSQTVVGQGEDLVIDGVTIETGSETQTPIINVTGLHGDAFELADDNAIMGLNIGDTQGDGAGFYNDDSDVGTLTVSNVAISGEGQAFHIHGGTLDVTLDSLESTESAYEGIYLEGVSGSFSVTGATDISLALSDAIAIENSSGLDVDFTTIDIDQSGGGLYVDGGIGDFDATAIQIDDTSCIGIDVVGNNGDTFSFGDVDIGQASISGGVCNGVYLDSSTSGASFDFASLNVTASDGFGLVVYDSNLSIAGTTNTIDATGDSAMDLGGVDLGAGATFASVSSTDSFYEGIDLNDVDGDLTINGGSVNGSGEEAIDITGGTGAFTYAGTVTNTDDYAVDIQNRGAGAGDITLSGTITHIGPDGGINVSDVAGGTVTLSGNGSSINTTSGDSDAISLIDNTGATINFTGGGLDIDTTSGAGYLATGGGIVTVTGTGNTVNTTTGTGVTITDTTIGAGGVNFDGISVNGAINGVYLDSTGSGIFAVTGGAIQNTTGDGISLKNIGSATVSGMTITNAGEDGISIVADGSLAQIIANIINNTLGSANDSEIFVHAENSGVIQLVGYSGAANDHSAITTYLVNQNAAAVIDVLSSHAADGSIEGISISLFAADGQGEETAISLTGDTLAPIVSEAISRWAEAGLSDGDLAKLNGVSVQIADLADGMLGATLGNLVLVDVNGAGNGWFVDGTPADNEEFAAGVNGALVSIDDAASGMDLLSVVMHELGHVLGLDHGDESGLMGETLDLGNRLLPENGDLVDPGEIVGLSSTSDLMMVA